MSYSSLRRRVLAAGGYYSRQAKMWVLPAARHNCTPWSVDAQYFWSLEDAAEAAADHAAAVANAREFGRAEADYLRRNA